MAKRFDYGKMQGTAKRLLNRFNQGVIELHRTTAGTPINEWTPGEDITVTYTLDATAAAVTVDQANAKYIDGTVITTADLVVTCAVPSIVPAMTDTLTIDGVAKTIKKIVQLPSAGVPVAFKIFVQG